VERIRLADGTILNYFLDEFNEYFGYDVQESAGSPSQVTESMEHSGSPDEASGIGGRRRQESERRRERILDAARACFGAEGYAGATVARIAEEAGVSNGLLYQFFRSKDHLFEVVLDRVVRDWVRALVPPDDAAPARAALEGMFRRSVAFCASTPLLPALLTRDRALQLQRLSGVTADRVEPHRELVASILRRGIERGELRPDLDVRSLADVICVLQAEYSRRAYSADPQFPVTPEILDAVVRMIDDAVRVN
jgi:AcrR family transcriptional regulator